MEEKRKTGRPPYHHGDLRHALLEAAEKELADKGIEGFTLRGCAKRAGVSHAAPAHHFRDANGLLTALAALGFERFLSCQKARQAGAPQDPRSQLVASGLGYIDFALANPALFRLMFASGRADFASVDLARNADAAFDYLVKGVETIRGRDPYRDAAGMLEVMATWGLTHGLADLMLSGRMKPLLAMPVAARDAALSEIIGRAFPERPDDR
ncbi:TetR/AcrR family transcriptional regulator [Aquibium microcysteis]|uniref:TetR/AcrR family transcriptional regulator n=1 Tax=Aquibium microcysteis TaxID=675281 RepID=UPI001AED1F05|nr:TetR/AcrR family transcriptional regulator [Aquibium microcysteis]